MIFFLFVAFLLIKVFPWGLFLSDEGMQNMDKVFITRDLGWGCA
jgi:hypothetical protein